MNVLAQLLEKLVEITNDELSNIVNEYLNLCEEKSEYPWRYYYIKYDSFRPGRYGKYSWSAVENGFYDMHVLYTESQWSENSYQPFLYEACTTNIVRDELGHCAKVGDNLLACENAEFVLYKVEEWTKIDSIPVKRNEQGVDIENRIELLKNYYRTQGII
jgi:hypothetical protein